MGGIVEQYRTRLVQSLSAALDRAVDAGSLPAIEPPRFLVEVPREATTETLPPTWRCCWPSRLKWHPVKLPKPFCITLI